MVALLTLSEHEYEVLFIKLRHRKGEVTCVPTWIWDLFARRRGELTIPVRCPSHGAALPCLWPPAPAPGGTLVVRWAGHLCGFPAPLPPSLGPPQVLREEAPSCLDKHPRGGGSDASLCDCPLGSWASPSVCPRWLVCPGTDRGHRHPEESSSGPGTSSVVIGFACVSFLSTQIIFLQNPHVPRTPAQLPRGC